MADNLPDLDRRITEALSALRCARAIVERYPSRTSLWHEDMAERTLDGLLERRSRAGRCEASRTLQSATAMSRPDRPSPGR